MQQQGEGDIVNNVLRLKGLLVLEFDCDDLVVILMDSFIRHESQLNTSASNH